MFHYVVRCAIAGEEPTRGFLAWLRDRHVADVCAAGAKDADLVLLDPSSTNGEHVIEIRYRFASREAFARYEREDAPRLRAEGLEAARRLGLSPGAGISFTRTTGESIDWRR